MGQAPLIAPEYHWTVGHGEHIVDNLVQGQENLESWPGDQGTKGWCAHWLDPAPCRVVCPQSPPVQQAQLDVRRCHQAAQPHGMVLWHEGQ